jgi:hypothetical protein
MKIADILGLDLINPGQLTTIGNLLKDAQWRVRMAAVEFIGQFSVKFGKEAYQKNFESIFMTYLNNSAAAVRNEGIK